VTGRTRPARITDRSYEIRYIDVIRRRRQAEPPPPMAQELLLPLHQLDPEIFERLVDEYVWRLPDTRRVRLYGRWRQTDYGLDAVAVTWSGDGTVYQAKRYQQLTPTQIKAAVHEYAGVRVPPGSGVPPRRFAASRFVLVTSALFESDTANVDEAERLSSEHEGDIGIDVVGAEQMSRVLHDSVSVVSSVFSSGWTRVFCGAEPPPEPAHDPAAYGVLEGPLALLGLDQVDRVSREAAQAEPSRSAALDADIAEELEAAGFPGHARVIRGRAAATLLDAGRTTDGFVIMIWPAPDCSTEHRWSPTCTSACSPWPAKASWIRWTRHGLPCYSPSTTGPPPAPAWQWQPLPSPVSSPRRTRTRES
jgi:hypothetical protein